MEPQAGIEGDFIAHEAYGSPLPAVITQGGNRRISLLSGELSIEGGQYTVTMRTQTDISGQATTSQQSARGRAYANDQFITLVGEDGTSMRLQIVDQNTLSGLTRLGGLIVYRRKQ
jgi:hypothetical protein